MPSKIIFRSKVTLTNISICLLVVVGNIFVAQPTFIFGPNIATHHVNVQTYTCGVILGFTAAFITGYSTVLQANCTSIPLPYFMLCSGIAKLVLGLLCPAFGLPNYITDLDRFSQVNTKE